MLARLCLALAAAAFVFPAGARVEDSAAPLRIFLRGFDTGDLADYEIANKIENTVAGDLRRSGSLDALGPFDHRGPFDAASTILNPPPPDVSGAPPFDYWRAEGARALVTGSVMRQSDGQLKTEVRLWDVTQELQLSGQQYLTEPENWRRVAHVIADHIYEELTGKESHFEADDRN
jgi:TolB protein